MIKFGFGGGRFLGLRWGGRGMGAGRPSSDEPTPAKSGAPAAGKVGGLPRGRADRRGSFLGCGGIALSNGGRRTANGMSQSRTGNLGEPALGPARGLAAVPPSAGGWAFGVAGVAAVMSALGRPPTVAPPALPTAACCRTTSARPS